MTSPVLVSVVDGIADVRLNRPDKLNAVDATMSLDLVQAAIALRSEPGLRCVVISGAGSGFCAGLDTSSFVAMKRPTWNPAAGDTKADDLGDDADPALGRGQRTVLIWHTLAVPVIAAIHGPAVGFGLQLALGADIRIMSPDARLGALESNWGLAPDCAGGALLPRLVGPDNALDLMTTGRIVRAEEALRLGLVTEVVDDPYAAAHERARTYAGRSPGVLRAVTRLVRMASRGGFEDVLLAEREEMELNVGSPNQREAVTAALERRTPIFADEIGPPAG